MGRNNQTTQSKDTTRKRGRSFQCTTLPIMCIRKKHDSTPGYANDSYECISKWVDGKGRNYYGIITLDILRCFLRQQQTGRADRNIDSIKIIIGIRYEDNVEFPLNNNEKCILMYEDIFVYISGLPDCNYGPVVLFL